MSLVGRIAVLLLVGLSFPSTGSARQCLGRDAATIIQEEFAGVFGERGEIDSMTVLDDGLVMTVLFERVLYRFRASSGGNDVLVFLPVPPPVVPSPLEEEMGFLASRLPPTVWTQCGEERPQERLSGIQLLAAEDFNELPPEACRPAPGRVCSDEYWTLSPRLSYSGAVATYFVHAIVFVGLLVAGFVWLRRNRPSLDE